jgi:hypothetical protein
MSGESRPDIVMLNQPFVNESISDNEIGRRKSVLIPDLVGVSCEIHISFHGSGLRLKCCSFCAVLGFFFHQRRRLNRLDNLENRREGCAVIRGEILNGFPVVCRQPCFLVASHWLLP